MGAKEGISGGYIESWHQRTKNWEVLEYTEDRAALVVGCRPGNIGEQIAEELSERGFGRVHARDIDPTEGIWTSGVPFDANDSETLYSTRFDKYDTLVLANGMTNLDWIEDQRLDQIQAVVDSKLTASVKAVSEFASQTMDNEQIKHIVLIGSMAHKSVLNASAPYCAACAGLNHFARCAAWELAPKGFRVFIVNPSNVEGTPMTEETIAGVQRYRGITRAQAEEYWSAVRALPEWLTREDIAGLVGDLVTDDKFRWLAGVPLDMGGGLR
jgi:NAD(P)-dependent dehydrogenase (short-subunit alcohol dehydrogenase family)